jgi:hypothetical protein
MVMGCAGSDGRDGRDGADGATGDTGPSGKDGADGTDGATGATGKDGAPGMDGATGSDGSDGADGSDILQGTGAPAAGAGKDGDLYIDTTSRDVYQKGNGTWTVITNLSGGPPGPKGDTGADGMDGSPGTDGQDGADGASVRTGAGVPAAGLGSIGDVYIDSTTGDLYSKSAGGWAKTGSLKGPAGTDGADGQDGADGVDVKDTLGGVRWFAFAMTAGFVDAPKLITSEVYTPTSSAASFTFTGAGQHGRLAFDTAGSYLPGGVDLSAFESLDVSATVTGGAVTNVVVLLTDGAQKGCQWNLATAAGPDYNIDFADPTSCYNNSAGLDFDLTSVTQIQVGIVSSAAGARTLTVTNLALVDNL